MPNVRFNESYTLKDPPKNARPRQQTYMNHDSGQSPLHQTHSALCAKCRQPFGALANRFEQVTGSYYLHLDETTKSYVELKPEGETKVLGRKHQALEGCTVQALACTCCANRFAFRCVATPLDKRPFNHRLFFKLEHLSIVNKSTGAHEPPSVDSATSTLGHTTRPAAALATREDSPASPPAQPPMPSVEHPDYEAARGILSRKSWNAVHVQWERRTREALSPRSFGERLKPTIEELQKSHSNEQMAVGPQHSRDSSEVRPIANGRTVPQANGYGQIESARPRAPDSLEAQRADINRLDASLARVQAELGQLRGLMADLRYELQSTHSRRASGGPEDPSTLDSLTETVGRMASRTGEIDGLRLEMTTLKSKVKRMEEAQGLPGTPSQPSQSFARSEPSIQPAPPHPSDIIHRGWNAVNTAKRKSVDETASFDPHKRPRTDYRTPSGDVKVAYAPHAAPAPVHVPVPTPAPASAPAPPAPAPAPPTLAPIRSESQESWHPDSQRLPPLRGMHQGGRGGTRPPRLQPPQEFATPEWERASWDENRVDRDGYYRPLAHPTSVPLSPGSAKRGHIVRRGTSGGSSTGASLQYIDPAPTKRTRQRPIRNEAGILIRKDGKPDQRSISSPQNLRKVHERRMAEQERGSQGSPNSPSSPADTDAPRSAGELGSAVGSSGSGSPPFEQQDEIDEAGMRAHSRAASKHDRVMSRMFPYGLDEDTHRMNHAAHIFEPGSQEHHAAQLRTAMEKQEVQQPRDREGHDLRASGSINEPSSDQKGSSKDATDKSTGPSTATTATIGGGSTDTPQDSDNRPLKARQVIHEEEATVSGSVYHPSPTEGGKVE